ncbi:hypothetical protein ES703_04076 [subsurface metagenome]
MSSLSTQTHNSLSVPGFIISHACPRLLHLYSVQGISSLLHTSQSRPFVTASHGIHENETTSILVFLCVKIEINIPIPSPIQPSVGNPKSHVLENIPFNFNAAPSLAAMAPAK